MAMNDEILRKLALVSRVDILREAPDCPLESLGDSPGDNPVYRSESLRSGLRSHALSQDFPFLTKDPFDVYFSAFRTGDTVYYIGPMSSQRQTAIRNRQFYHSYGIDSEDVRPLRFFTLQAILYIVELCAEAAGAGRWEDSDLLLRNRLAQFDYRELKEKHELFLLNEEDINEDDEAWRHTYRQEQEMMTAVREGNTPEALRLSRLMDGDTGRLSGQDIHHWHNLAVIGITLTARAAIEGGLAPQTAYQISGYYIAKCDGLNSVTQILGMRDYAIRDMTDRVHDKLIKHRTSSYTEICKTYVSRHYREKLYLEDIAEVLGISPTYLSRLFKKDTGIRLQDYIVRVRMEKAANMLRYSDRSISQIAQYVNFPSQSYMGRVFKKEMHMTPKEYRDRYHAAEWQSPET